MDKKIEELKETLRRRCVEGEVASCVDADCYLCEAKFLINAGYRKIPENAVVVTGTETEERFEDLMVEFDEMGFMPYTTHPSPEEYVETWKQRLIFVFGKLRKETAEKFAVMLKGSFDISVEGYSTSEVINEIEDKIDEICKEITEGKV